MSRTRPRTPEKDWRPDFLAAFAETGMVREAAKRVGVGRSTVYDERRRNEHFAAKWAEIEQWTTEEMEQEAHRRAVQGVEEPIFYKGQLVKTVRRYSDTLLIFLLKSRRPEVYRDNVRVEHGGTIKHEVESKLDAEIDALLADMAARGEAEAVGAAAGRGVAEAGED